MLMQSNKKLIRVTLSASHAETLRLLQRFAPNQHGASVLLERAIDDAYHALVARVGAETVVVSRNDMAYEDQQRRQHEELIERALETLALDGTLHRDPKTGKPIVPCCADGTVKVWAADKIDEAVNALMKEGAK